MYITFPKTITKQTKNNVQLIKEKNQNWNPKTHTKQIRNSGIQDQITQRWKTNKSED